MAGFLGLAYFIISIPTPKGLGFLWLGLMAFSLLTSLVAVISIFLERRGIRRFLLPEKEFSLAGLSGVIFLIIFLTT